MEKSSKTKVSFIGAGGVATAAAFAIGLSNLADEMEFIDIRGRFAKGKAMDLAQGFSLSGRDIRVGGGSSYAPIKGSDAIIITAGVANTGGSADRESLLAKNRTIIKNVARSIRRAVPKGGWQPFIVLVTNPLDIMLKHFIEAGGFDKRKTIGAGNLLDAERFRFYFAREFGMPERDIETLVVGQHGRKMAYLLSQTKVGGRPIAEFMRRRRINAARVRDVCRKATNGASEILGLMEEGGTYYGPAISICSAVSPYLRNKPRTMSVSAWLDGEYGFKDCCLGVPAVIDGSGIRKIEELKLPPDELAAFEKAYKLVKRLADE